MTQSKEQQTFKILKQQVTEKKKRLQLPNHFLKIVLHTMGSIAALTKMTGSLETFWNLLDILQLLSYIKYINIPFPNNLNLQISDNQSLIGCFRHRCNLAGNERRRISQTINKFKEDKINAYFLGNFSNFLLCFCLAYTNYFFSLLMSKVAYLIGPWAINKLNFALLKKIHKAGIFFRRNANEFYYSAFIRIFLANYYDVMFAACIQVNNLNWDNANMAVNSALSIITMVGQAYLIAAIASKLTSFTKKTTISNRNQFDSIFQGTIYQSLEPLNLIYFQKMII